jgi:cytochrome c oxidase cbb3-type subunit III
MSSRCPASPRVPAWWLGFCLAALAVAGCDRETRDYRGRPLPETGPIAHDPRGASYEGNAFHIAQGGRLYAWMNCSGCHAHGGGGMGPPLMDDEWRYGGTMEQIAATILDGRPNGMPPFRGRITEQQAWQLAAWVRAQSAQPRQDALPARADELRNTEPLTIDERKPIRNTTPKADDRTEE